MQNMAVNRHSTNDTRSPRWVCRNVYEG